MKTDQPLLLYLRSGLNRVLLVGAAVVAVMGALFSGPLGKLLFPLGAIAVYLGVTVVVLQSRRGATAIIGERDEDRAKAASFAIGASRGVRERIAVLRIADLAVDRAVKYFLQISGEYLEACGRIGTYSPEGSQKIQEVLELLQVYLERLDGASTDEEYAVKAPDQARSAREENAAATVSRIHDAAAFVKERMATDLNVIAAQDRLELMDEMEGKQ